jgi:heme exporter protein A
MGAEPVIEARRLVRRFGARLAVADVDLTVRSGEFLTIFGPNGAGKTTLLRVLCGLLKPSSGEVELLGISLSRDAVAAKKRIGFIGHASFLYAGLTARENLNFYARLYGVTGGRRRAEALLGEVGLSDRACSGSPSPSPAFSPSRIRSRSSGRTNACRA